MTLSKRIEKINGDQRSDRQILLETNRLVNQLALKRGKTLQELELAIRMVDESIGALNLSPRTLQALIGNNISTVRQLLQHSSETLLEFENIGRWARNEIIEALATYGIRLTEHNSPHHVTIANTPPASNTEQRATPQAVAPNSLRPETAAWIPQSYKTGDLVRHPTRNDWGTGEILSFCDGDKVKVAFEIAGEKMLALSAVQLIKVGSTLQPSVTPKASASLGSETKKVPCSNCGQPTQFSERAAHERVALGWCDSCFKQSQRTFEDRVTGEKRYIDELRTVDGIKHRYYSPK